MVAELDSSDVTVFCRCCGDTICEDDQLCPKCAIHAPEVVEILAALGITIKSSVADVDRMCAIATNPMRFRELLAKWMNANKG